MSKEISGRFGMIAGTYKKESHAPIVAKPCEHVTRVIERTLRSNILVVIHGKANGEASITEYQIGSGEQKQ